MFKRQSSLKQTTTERHETSIMYDLNSAKTERSISDMPMGLAMRLAQDVKAMESFVKLNDIEKQNLIEYVQSSTTGNEAKEKIRTAMAMLDSGIVTL